MVALCLHEHRDIGYPLMKEGIIGGADVIMSLDYSVCGPGCDTSFTGEADDEVLSDGAASFGIKIIKTETGISEEACIANVTNDIDKANEILLMLANNSVTPCCLRDVLEEICASEQTVRA